MSAPLDRGEDRTVSRAIGCRLHCCYYSVIFMGVKTSKNGLCARRLFFVCGIIKGDNFFPLPLLQRRIRLWRSGRWKVSSPISSPIRSALGGANGEGKSSQSPSKGEVERFFL